MECPSLISEQTNEEEEAESSSKLTRQENSLLVRASSYSSHIEMINKDIEKDEEARRKSTAGFMKQ